MTINYLRVERRSSRQKPRHWVKVCPVWRVWQKILLGCCLWWCFAQPGAIAASPPTALQDRLETYPNWTEFPPVVAVKPGEDLVYPDWLAGTWQVTSTLTDQVAPLAPDIVTPGFEQNRLFINQPLQLLVKFEPRRNFITKAFTIPSLISGQVPIVANRAFNGTEIARAYLGEKGFQSVQVDPTNPNRQLTRLQGDRLLISTVTDRATETPNPQEFISSEITQQQFQGAPQLYLNTVETTTDYVRRSPEQITAKQITAIYLSPNDPNFFQGRNQPVALYRYHLRLDKQPE
jgi:hypothetical protein